MSEEAKTATPPVVEKAPEAAAAAAKPAPSRAEGPAAKPRGKKKVHRTVSIGRAYVHASYNNTIVTLTDANGNVLSWSSAGSVGFKGPKKSTPYAASVIVKAACDKAHDYGLREVYAFIRGIGSGREAAVRALHANGINVLAIKDVTPIPHNGCRAPKPRRI